MMTKAMLMAGALAALSVTGVAAEPADSAVGPHKFDLQMQEDAFSWLDGILK